ncbi:MAG: DUF4245 domain-containing protein [Micropruina sp.]
MAARRPSPTVPQMLVAVAALIIPVVLIYLWFSRIPEPEARAVNWQSVVAEARAEAPYPVVAPTALPDTWTAVRARWTPLGQPGLNQQPAIGNTLQLGFLTPDRIYIGLDQRDTDPQGLIRAAGRGGAADGESELNGETWQRYVSDDDRTRALVRSSPGSTVVVSGDLPYEALEAFATTLA